MTATRRTQTAVEMIAPLHAAVMVWYEQIETKERPLTCDDGNDVDSDDCLSNCQAARCGDGVVGPGGAAMTGTTTRSTVQQLSTCDAATASCRRMSAATTATTSTQMPA